MCIIRFFSVLAISLLLASSSIIAQNTYFIKADGTGDFPNIQTAIIAAVDGDTIKLEAATFTGNGNSGIIFGGKGIVVMGEDGTDNTIIDCSGAGDQGFIFANAEDSTSVLRNLTIRGGFAEFAFGGGILIEDASPIINGVTVDSCSAGNGGGIFITGPASSPFIQNCEIKNCTAFGVSALSGGGGIAVFSALPTILDCDIHHNVGVNGGGILVSDEGAYESGTYSGNRIHHNTAGSDGGGCKVLGGSASLQFTENLIYANTAVQGGGMVLNSIPSSADISSNTVAENSADLGAGIVIDGAGARVEKTIVAFNTGSAFAVRCEGIAGIVNCSIIYNPGISDVLNCGGIQNRTDDPLFCSGLGTYDYEIMLNSPATPGNSPCGQLIGALSTCGTTSIDSEELHPSTFKLYQNLPNPFNPTTMIQYYVPNESKILLQVYNVNGVLVKTLVDNIQSSGQKSAMWNGRNNNGQHVSSGVYFYRLIAEGFLQTRKMMLLK